MSTKNLPFYENEVKQKIEASDVPYLGLVDDLINESTHKFVYSALKGSGGKFTNVESGLKQFPALFVSYMVKAIKENLGDKKQNAVYGCLNLSVGRAKDFKPKQNELQSLWKTFRKACDKLELPLSNRQFGPNYMVDTYLEQVGVPDARIDQLWKEMTKFAKQNGLPDEHDIGEQNAWHAKFCMDLKSTFPVRIKRALENDAQGFYVSRFLEKTQDEDDSSSKETFERTILPVLSYDGEILMLSLFPREGENYDVWEVDIDDKHQRIEVDDQQYDIFIDLSTQKITAKMSGGSDVSFCSWQDNNDDQLALFDDTSHRFISSHNMGENGVVLSPGRYRVLSRFDIDNHWLQTDETLEDGFYTGELELASGAIHRVEYGPSFFEIRAHSQAVIELKGDVITPYAGPDFYSSDSLLISSQLPKEWDSDGEYELEIRSPRLEKKLCVPVKFDGDYKLDVSLTSVTEDWSACVDRITVILRRSGQSRSLARTSAVVWFGLETLEQGYKPICRNQPVNLNKERCENIRRDDDSILVKDQNVPFSTLYFSLSGNRELSFKFALPGTYIYLDDPAHDVRREVLIRPGTTLSVNYEDRRMIHIYSTEVGELRLGKRVFHEDFIKRPWVKFSVSALVDHIDSENTNLVFATTSYEQTYEKVLLKLVSPHLIRDWKSVQKTQSVNVEFTAFSQVDNLVVTATELFMNQRHQKSYEPNHGLCQNSFGEIGGMLISHESSNYKKQQLELYVDNLSDGVWLLQINSLISGKWGSLSNERKDQYAIGLVIEQGKIGSFGGNNIHQLNRLDTQEKTRLLSDLNSLLSTCYELSSWESIAWMKDLWCRLVVDNDVMADENIKYILPIVEQLPDENTSASWVPMLHIGGYNPSLYARDASFYQRMDIGSSINLRCFKAMYESNNDLAGVISCELVVDALVTAFENTPKIITESAKPIGLDLKKMDELFYYIFSDSQWTKMLRRGKEPALGDLLGGHHLAYAQHECLLNCRRTQVGNDFLRPAMNRMALLFDSEDIEIMRILIPDEYFQNEEKELLIALSRLASGLAKSCRQDARGNDDLSVLLQKLKQGLLRDSKNLSPILSFFMAIAGDLFHYYLLLWEIYFESKDA